MIVNDSSSRQISLESAEASFRESISVANPIRAKTVALRAPTSLARLLAGEGRSSEASAVVALMLKGFTEGFDTRDLVEAKEIASLSKRSLKGRGPYNPFRTVHTSQSAGKR